MTQVIVGGVVVQRWCASKSLQWMYKNTTSRYQSHHGVKISTLLVATVDCRRPSRSFLQAVVMGARSIFAPLSVVLTMGENVFSGTSKCH
jgi:hypothetical protein